MLLFVTFFTAHNFYKLLFTAETEIKFVTFFKLFLLLVTFINYFLLGQEGQGLYFIHCARGERGAHLDFFPSFFFTFKGGGCGG